MQLIQILCTPSPPSVKRPEKFIFFLAKLVIIYHSAANRNINNVCAHMMASHVD